MTEQNQGPDRVPEASPFGPGTTGRVVVVTAPAQRLGDPVDLPDRDPRELIWPCKCIPAALR